MNGPLSNVLGVDYGRRYTGLAISYGGFAPRPLKVKLENTKDERCIFKVIRTEHPWVHTAYEVVTIAKNEGAEGIVVGMPRTLDGDIMDRNTDSSHVIVDSCSS